MSILAALLIGSIIGAIGGFLLQENFDLLMMNVVLGIAGAILGGAIYFLTDLSGQFLLFSWSGVLFSVVGALIFVLGFSILHRVTPERVKEDDHQS